MYRGNPLCLCHTDHESLLPCIHPSRIHCLSMSSKKGCVRMVISIQRDTSSTYTTASLRPPNQDEPASLMALQEQSEATWLSQLHLCVRAFALPKEGICGPAVASALTAFNSSRCPPVDTLVRSLATATGEL